MLDKALSLVRHLKSVHAKARAIGITEPTLRRWIRDKEGVSLGGPNLDRLRDFLARHDALGDLGVELTYEDGLRAGRAIVRAEVQEAVATFIADLRHRLGVDGDEVARIAKLLADVRRLEDGSAEGVG